MVEALVQRMTSLGLCLSLLFVGALGADYIVPSPSGDFDPDCVDKLGDCPAFGKSACEGPYAKWAWDNCRNYCGLCKGPTTPAPECKDTIDNCDSYGAEVCGNKNYRAWALDRCRYFCSHHSPDFCSDAARQLQDSLTTTTTIAPENCVDKVDCRLYEPQTCSEAYKSWARDNCMNYCGYCVGVSTTPQPCTDKLSNCNTYDRAVCTDQQYRPWVEDNCRKYCGICGGSPTPPMPVMSGKRMEEFKRQMDDISTEAPPTMSTSTESPPVEEKPIAAAGGQPIEGTPPPRLTTTTSTEAPPTTPLPTTTSTESPPSTTTSTEMPITTTTSTELPPSTPSTTELPPLTVSSTEKPGEPHIVVNIKNPKSRVTTSGVQPSNTNDSVIGIPTTPEVVATTDNGVPQPVVITATEYTAVSTEDPVVITSQVLELTTDAAQTTMGVSTPPTSAPGPEITTQEPMKSTPTTVTTAAEPEVTTQRPVVVEVTKDVVSLPTKALPFSTEVADTTIAIPKPEVTTDALSKSTIAFLTPFEVPVTNINIVTTAHGHHGHGHESTTEAMNPTDACEDKIPNCRSYGKEQICVPTSPYYAWASVRCRKYCKIGNECEGLTTPYVPCMDKNPNCAQYNDDLCTNPSFRVFREDNCRAFCGLCTTISTEPTIPMSTTRDPISVFLETNCTDILSDCNYYSDDSCYGVYEGWARRNCALRCGYCPGKTPLCVDIDPLCPQYGDNFCTVYEGFSRTNCRKFCNLCQVPTHPTSDTLTSTLETGKTNLTPNAPIQEGSTPVVAVANAGDNDVFIMSTPESTDNQTADSVVQVKTLNGKPSNIPGFCTYYHNNQTQNIAVNATFKDGCDWMCKCEDENANKVVCTAVCPQWIRYPSVCSLVQVKDQCCEELQCPDGMIPATSRPVVGNP